MQIKAPRFISWPKYIGAGSMCAIGAASIIVIAFDIVPSVTPEDRLWGVLFSVIWTFFVFLASYSILKMPTEIVMSDGENVTITGPIHTTSLKVKQIIRLVDFNADGDWMLYHTKGKLDLRNFRHKELKGFLMWVVRANPGIEAPEELKGD